MKVILANAFSINMLQSSEYVWFEQIDEAYAKHLVSDGFISAIGHASTAALLSERLGVAVSENRIQVVLDVPSLLVVAQVKGRLPEGKILSDEEIQAVSVEYWKVNLQGHEDYRG